MSSTASSSRSISGNIRGISASSLLFTKSCAAAPASAQIDLSPNSVLAHKRLGTVYAVKSVLNSLYPASELEEWFSYDGTPGCFRLNVNVSDSANTIAFGNMRRRFSSVMPCSSFIFISTVYDVDLSHNGYLRRVLFVSIVQRRKHRDHGRLQRGYREAACGPGERRGPGNRSV